MRATTLIAFTTLLGLSACDASKMGAPLGAKPVASTPAACVAATAPACPPSQAAAKPLTMEPEGANATAASTAAPQRAKGSAPHRAHHHAAPRVRTVVVYRQARTHPAPARRNAYAGGYTGHSDAGAMPQSTVRTYERRYETPHVYVTPDVTYGQQGYGDDDRYADRGPTHYEHHMPPPPPYVAPRVEERSYVETRRYNAPTTVYVPPAQHPYVETRRYDPPAPPPIVERRVYREVAPTYRVEQRQSAYETSRPVYRAPPPRPVIVEDDCRCQTQAAGRDRQGFLTWPGKQP